MISHPLMPAEHCSHTTAQHCDRLRRESPVFYFADSGHQIHQSNSLDHPRMYSLETGTTVNFKCLCQMSEKNLLFIRVIQARLYQVRGYSCRAVHEKCAKMNTPPSLPAGTREQIREQLVGLHQANVLHGDVC